ncbi:HAD family phosphatase [Streptomyces sp. B-S-A8]|uniref:HAD family phosphatase n=1 Tax=Streptomyces solicavernae TaxID=3043614 RepID=A0ABT6RXN2_9ACTN|nr:HAD family phosphatase [Streptomyces sp. B-S-A8]MDI3389158.1 HAD family phosphatase [Streptomyces sp. B-S-A8]
MKPFGPVEAVAFDYGGVLTSSVADSLARWHATSGIDPQSFADCMRAWLGRKGEQNSPVHELETGRLPAAEFEYALAVRLRRTDGSRPRPAGLLAGMFAGLLPDPAMWDLADELRARGTRVAVLSNSWSDAYPDRLYDGRFSPVVISGQVGLRKPDRVVYELLCTRLGLPPERVAFVDDMRPNVEGARRAGLHAVHHRDAGATRDALLPLLAPARAVEPATSSPGTQWPCSG